MQQGLKQTLQDNVHLKQSENI